MLMQTCFPAGLFVVTGNYNGEERGCLYVKLRKKFNKEINSDLIRIKFIDAAAVAQSNSSLLVGTTFATIIPDYAQINGTILGSCLIALGKDDYEQGVLSTTIALGSITREGNKISKIGAFSSIVQTIRARIAVFYTE